MSAHTIHCRGCNNHVARVPTMICVYPPCKEPKWGYSDDELRQMGFNIPVAVRPVPVLQQQPVQLTEYTIFCKAHNGIVAKTPNQICPHPTCGAKNFGYSTPEITVQYRPQQTIHALKCKVCASSVAKTDNNRCLVCSSANWGYTKKDIEKDRVQKPDTNFKPINYAIEAENIKKKYGTKNGQDIYGLQNTSLRIPKGQLVVVMGSSGCGKSTLLKCLNGENPATEGTVKLFGMNLYENYGKLKKTIGYVPQEDIVHSELTVEQSMYYAAKLRLPKSTTESEIQDKITEVLKNLKMDDTLLRHRKVSDLSGGQRKRVSIGVELLNDPNILFLDEPTSPLDPETIDELFIKCLKQLTKKGVTILMVTHKPEDLNHADALIFLGAKGYHAFYGSADEKIVCEYFNKNNIIEVYGLLGGDGNIETAKEWHRKYYSGFTAGVPNKKGTLERQAPESLFHQFYWLSRRYAHIKWSDTGNIILLLAQPLIIAGLIALVFEKLQVSVLFLTALSAIWFGVSNAGKEIVSELPIYKRERMYNLNLLTYIFSKIGILSLMAIVQVLIFASILCFRYSFDNDHINIAHFFSFTLNMFYLSVSATLLGLVLSAFYSTAEKVATVIPIFLMPQIMLAGIITKLDNKIEEALSYSMLGRWGTEILCRIQDGGKDFQKTVDKKTVIESVWNQMPAPMKPDSLIWTKTESLKLLNLYDKSLWGTFNSFNLNIAAITGLNGLMLLLIVFFLKKYDKL
jgi:ABC transport system ATP-binding/permease protein